MKKEKDIAVDVRIPVINLTIGDLAYLKSLGETSGVRCNSAKVSNKLLFLGLVEEGEVPVCPKKLDQWLKDREDSISKIRKAYVAEKWDDLYSAASHLKYLRKPEPYKGLVITKTGKELLKNGGAKSQTKKINGCL